MVGVSPSWLDLAGARRAHQQTVLDVYNAKRIISLLELIAALLVFNTVVINVWLVLHA